MKKITNQKSNVEKVIAPVKLLCLPCGNEEDPQVISKWNMNKEFFKIVEPVGERFEKIIFLKQNPDQPKLLLDADDEEQETIEEDKEEYEWEKEYRLGKKSSNGFSLKKKKNVENHYSILGLEEQFINSSQEEIRKAYKKAALIHHPDKKEYNDEDEKLEANKVWLRLKDAYETLSDPDKKFKYDSTFDFDDEIPTKDDLKKIKAEKDFFKMFGPVFLKNSIWSNKKPVPKIGDMNTDMKKVKRFYNFWFNFSSWREFEVEGENNLDEAENRWEKRAMLKENKKLKASLMKDEKQRIKDLIDLAYSSDPRVIAEEKKITEEKERIKKERNELAIKQKQEKEELEKKLQQEFEERKKREAEELILLKKDLTEQLFNLINKELELSLNSSETLNIQLNLSIDNMKIVINETLKGGNKDEKLKIFKELSSKYYGIKFADEKKESSVWTRDEINNLQKATKKFPAGTGNRWEKIMEVVKTKGVNQIISMSHYLATNPGMKIIGETIDLKVLLNKGKEIVKDNKESKEKEVVKEIEVKEEVSKEKDDLNKENKDEWTDIQQKALEAGLKKYPGSMSANERWAKIASEVPDKNKKQCVERFKYLSNLIKKSNEK